MKREQLEAIDSRLLMNMIGTIAIFSLMMCLQYAAFRGLIIIPARMNNDSVNGFIGSFVTVTIITYIMTHNQITKWINEVSPEMPLSEEQSKFKEGWKYWYLVFLVPVGDILLHGFGGNGTIYYVYQIEFIALVLCTLWTAYNFRCINLICNGQSENER